MSWKNQPKPSPPPKDKRGRKLWISKNEVPRHYNYNSAEIKKLKYKRFIHRQKRVKREALRYLREEGKKTRLLYESQGRLDELHQLIRDLKESGVRHDKAVYDRDGNLIPLLKAEKEHPTYDKKIAEKVTARISLGETLQKICAAKGMPGLATVRSWYRDIPEFKIQLDDAHSERLEFYLDELFDLMADVKSDKVGIKQAEFVANQIKWFAEKLHPKFIQKQRGDALNVNIGDDGKVQFNITLAGTDITMPKIETDTKDVPLIEYSKSDV